MRAVPRHPAILLLAAHLGPALGGCGEPDRSEGTEPGDCVDGMDNDGDAAFDCSDPGCAASPDCAPAGGDSGDGGDDGGDDGDDSGGDSGGDDGGDDTGTPAGHSGVWVGVRSVELQVTTSDGRSDGCTGDALVTVLDDAVQGYLDCALAGELAEVFAAGSAPFAGRFTDASHWTFALEFAPDSPIAGTLDGDGVLAASWELDLEAQGLDAHLVGSLRATPSP